MVHGIKLCIVFSLQKTRGENFAEKNRFRAFDER